MDPLTKIERIHGLVMPYHRCTTNPRDTNFFPPMDRVVQSESIQYNRVGSKDLNFVDYEQKQYFPLILNGHFVIHDQNALPSSAPILVVPRDTNFFQWIEFQSESIQYNRVGSKDLNFVMSRNSISH